MANANLADRSVASELQAIVDSPEITKLIDDLEGTRWTGRPGYGSHALVAISIAKTLFQCTTWRQIIRLAHEHDGLREALGGKVPSEHACSRFKKKLCRFGTMLDGCVDATLAALRARNPTMGTDLAIDASDLPAYANGQKYVSKGGRERRPEEYSDPDAKWGHRSAVNTRKGGGYYGFKIHLAVCMETELPVAWEVAPANRNESLFAPGLIDEATRRDFSADTCAMDKAYDLEPLYDEFEKRDSHPVIPLREDTRVKKGWADPPRCEHGVWKYGGTDYGRKETKWRCPESECVVSHRWIKPDRFDPLIPRSTNRYRKLKKARGSVEREFGRLKDRWALAPLRVRRLKRVQLHTDLTILAKLSCALARARAAPLAA